MLRNFEKRYGREIGRLYVKGSSVGELSARYGVRRGIILSVLYRLMDEGVIPNRVAMRSLKDERKMLFSGDLSFNEYWKRVRRYQETIRYILISIDLHYSDLGFNSYYMTIF